MFLSHRVVRVWILSFILNGLCHWMRRLPGCPWPLWYIYSWFYEVVIVFWNVGKLLKLPSIHLYALKCHFCALYSGAIKYSKCRSGKGSWNVTTCYLALCCYKDTHHSSMKVTFGLLIHPLTHRWLRLVLLRKRMLAAPFMFLVD